MENNFRTLISAILAKVSALHPKKSDVYTKSEVYTKEETYSKSYFDALSRFEIIDVAELPTENIKNCLYRTHEFDNCLYEWSSHSNMHIGNGDYTFQCVDEFPEVGVDDRYHVYYNVKNGAFKIFSNGAWHARRYHIVHALKDAIGEDCILLHSRLYMYYSGSWVVINPETAQGSGWRSNVFNYVNNTASGNYSHAEGYKTTASGNYSHAEGCETTASGDYSHVEGYWSHAEGDFAHAEGRDTTTSGDYSHAEGYDTTASSTASHAEGFRSHAEGAASHAEGRDTTTSGDYSHAEGESTTASGDRSHAEGYETTASGGNQHVQGKYNVDDSEGKYAHIVGNGEYRKLSNAHTLDWNGNAWFQGNVYVGGTGQDDAAAKRLLTEDDLSNIPGGGGTGSSSQAIIDVIELPETNIRSDCFYRLLTAKFVSDYYTVDGWTCHVANGLPSVGEPVSTDMVNITAYYNTRDNEVYGYADANISAAGGVPVGWYPIGTLAQAFNIAWGGVITDPSEMLAETAHVLLTKDFYMYQDGWCKVPFAYEKPPKFDITWDGDMTDRVALDMSLLGYAQGVYFVKVSDNVFTTDDLNGGTLTDKHVDGVYERDIDDDSFDTSTYPGAISIDNYVVVVYDSDTLCAALGIPTGMYPNGVYFWTNTEEGGYVSSLASKRNITKIESKYLDLDSGNHMTYEDVDSMIQYAIYGAIGGSY